ncbi:MAG: gluconeogenesis factor YvcK family protein [Acidimicrobiales bacterium]
MIRHNTMFGSVVVIGGGHGLSSTLEAIVGESARVTALVGVADDGGSSGRLRSLYGLVPPGDLRRCLSVLLEPTTQVGDLLEHRFPSGEFEGHAIGNLLLVAAMQHFQTSPTTALSVLGEIFRSRGEVVPLANEPMTLCAQLLDGTRVRGQVGIHLTRDIDRIWVEPGGLEVDPAVSAAILEADLIVVGPGSLFTSVLAALVHPGVLDLLRAAAAPKVFVANLREQRQETIGLTALDQVRALERHGFKPDTIVLDRCSASLGELEGFGGRVLAEEVALADSSHAVHDPERLRKVLAVAAGAVTPLDR